MKYLKNLTVFIFFINLIVACSVDDLPEDNTPDSSSDHEIITDQVSTLIEVADDTGDDGSDPDMGKDG